MSTPDPPDPRELVRVSDADRDAVAHHLRDAFAEGRLDPDEHGERLDTVYSAKTAGELARVTDDLPEPAAGAGAPVPRPFSSPRPLYADERIVAEPSTSGAAFALMGGAERSGHWILPRVFRAFTMWGGTHLDLREARFSQRESTIRVVTLMGGTKITVPDDMHVRVHGLAIGGAFGTSGRPVASGTVPPDAPVVHIRGFCMFGGVTAVRRARKHHRAPHDEEE